MVTANTRREKVNLRIEWLMRENNIKKWEKEMGKGNRLEIYTNTTWEVGE